jgi:hypothetical protein
MAICEALRNQMGELFRCEAHGDFVRVRTPFLYPDGDYIDLFVRHSDGTPTISDLGETTRWLRMQSVSAHRSPKQRQLIEDVCLTHGVEFYRGMLSVRAEPDFANLAPALTRLAQAVLRVSDIWFTFRTRAFESLADEVEQFLSEGDIPFDRGEKLVGRSGRSYTIDFHTRSERRSSLVAVLSTGSRSAAARVVEHVMATWYDLSHMRVGPQSIEFVSLFDDALDVWRPEDFRLVEDFSTVARWSAPEEFRSFLVAA